MTSRAGGDVGRKLRPTLTRLTDRLQAGPAGGERGSVLVWLLVLAPVMLAFGGLVLDGGRQISARQDAANLAEQGARSAVDQLAADSRGDGVDDQFRRVDPAAASAAACGYVRAARPEASCSTAVLADGQVTVSVTIRTRTQLLNVIGVRELTASGRGQARPAFGADQEVLTR